MSFFPPKELTAKVTVGASELCFLAEGPGLDEFVESMMMEQPLDIPEWFAGVTLWSLLPQLHCTQ